MHDASVITNTTIEGNLAGAGGANRQQCRRSRSPMPPSPVTARRLKAEAWHAVQRCTCASRTRSWPRTSRKNCADAPISARPQPRRRRQLQSCREAATIEDVDPQLGIARLLWWSNAARYRRCWTALRSKAAPTPASIVDQRGVAATAAGAVRHRRRGDAGASVHGRRYTGGSTSNPAPVRPGPQRPRRLRRPGSPDRDASRSAGGALSRQRRPAPEAVRRRAAPTRAARPVALIKKKPGRRS